MAIRTIPRQELDTDTVPVADRTAAYQREIDDTLATVFLAQPVHAHLKAWHMGAMRVIALDASARRSDRTAMRIAHDRYDGISIQLAVAGHSVGEAAGRRVVSDPGTVMILDFAQPFHMIDQETRQVVNVAIPRSVLAAHIPDVRALHGVVLDAETGALLAALLPALVPSLERIPVDTAPALGDILVRLLLVALGHDPAVTLDAPADRRTVMRDRAVHLIDGRLGSADLTPEWLVARLGVSRTELYAAFEEDGGIATVIRNRRLAGARTALADRRDVRRIGEIAFAFGFASEAHFARCFRATFGRTASQVRRERD